MTPKFCGLQRYAIAAILLLLTSGLIHAKDTTTTSETGFRLFEDELLSTDPVCIPENPQRIAAVDTFSLETLLVLGIKPVSGPFLQTFLRDHPQFTEMLDGVVETEWPANPEATASS